MTVYVFDGTMDGLLTAVFDAFSLKEQPEQLLAKGDALPLFCVPITLPPMKRRLGAYGPAWKSIFRVKP